jgi:predicted RNA-binding protein with PUA-like domain
MAPIANTVNYIFGGEEDTDQANKANEGQNIDNNIQYFLMKSEPESRMENGHDVKFSIDDLKAKDGPEGWEGQYPYNTIFKTDTLITTLGVRNFTARNVMRTMRKGDLAFFYHSNCGIPGIAGVMRIVEEHSVDETAFDPEHPKYDAKSDRERPRWELVHVEFVKKFDELISLKDLKLFALPGGVLEKMQMLRQGRLSVSPVTPTEWRFILDLANEPHNLGHPTGSDGYEAELDGEDGDDAANDDDAVDDEDIADANSPASPNSGNGDSPEIDPNDFPPTDSEQFVHLNIDGSEDVQEGASTF